MHMAAKTSRRPTQCKGRRFAKVLSALLLVAFLAISGCAARQLYQDYLVRHTQAQLTQLHRAVSTETVEEQVNSDWSRGMLELNPDYVGWLTVYGTEVDGPVVQGEDNDEYLRTDFYGDYWCSMFRFAAKTGKHKTPDQRQSYISAEPSIPR